jgi:archaellum biogenesis ATPase FlaH
MQKGVKDWAREYIKLGFSVFPIRKGTKVPSFPWEKYQTAPMNIEDVDRFFNDTDNIALACGPVSGVVVIDQDDYKKKAIDKKTIISSLMTITPRGGLHVYYKNVDGYRNTVNQKLGIDIRGKGGYVLVPPSVVDLPGDKKGFYLWNKEPTHDIIANLPEPPKEVIDPIYDHIVTSGETPRFDVSAAVGVVEGGRNDTLYKFSISALNFMKGDVVQALRMVNGTNNTFVPPLPQREVEVLFNSALKFYNANPPTQSRTLSSGNKYQVLKPIGEQELPGFQRRSSREDLKDALAVILGGKTKGISTGYKELDEILGGFVPGQSYLLYADTNVGKSLYAVNIVESLAQRGIASAYFDLENSMDMTMERLMFVANKGNVALPDWRKHVADGNGPEIIKAMTAVEPLLDSVYIWDLNKLNDRFGDITWAGVKKCIEEEIMQGAKVIIIDHLHYFAPSETDHSYLAEVARQVNNICSIYGVSILLVAHTKKGLLNADKSGSQVTTYRPNVDFINGSALISKHFKNIIALRRNALSTSKEERQQTTVYVDKTKAGPTGSFELVFDEFSLEFKSIRVAEKLEKLEKPPKSVDGKTFTVSVSDRIFVNEKTEKVIRSKNKKIIESGTIDNFVIEDIVDIPLENKPTLSDEAKKRFEFAGFTKEETEEFEKTLDDIPF